MLVLLLSLLLLDCVSLTFGLLIPTSFLVGTDHTNSLVTHLNRQTRFISTAA